MRNKGKTMNKDDEFDKYDDKYDGPDRKQWIWRILL